MRVSTLLVALLPSLAAAQSPRFTPGPCPFEPGDWLDQERIECRTLTVPENRDRPGGRTLRLAVAVMKSTAPNPLPDPVVFLSGGPGTAALVNVPAFSRSALFRAIREKRDLVVWDQRGTGRSEPAFCPDLSAALLSAEFTGADPVPIVSACRDRMLAEGLDFASYNSASGARDLDDLRRALGVERWNLLGTSYGTRLALTALRDTPDGIRALILDGVSPIGLAGEDHRVENAARSLELVFRQCAADAACRREYPTLEADLYAAIAELDADPLPIVLPDSTLFPGGRVPLDGRNFLMGIFRALYDRHLVPLLPELIRQMRARNRDLLAGLAGALAPDPARENPWLLYAVECYEQAPLRSPDTVAAIGARHPRLAALADTAAGRICRAWHDHRADTALLRRPVASEVPVLLSSGEFDPVTPPGYARRVAEHLPRSRTLEVRAMGHATLPFTACTRALTIAFLDDPGRPLDTACLGGLPPVSFITDLRLVPGIARLARPNPVRMAWAGVTLALLASAVIFWPVGFLLRRLRRLPAPPRDGRHLARPVAALAALAACGFVAGLALAAVRAAARNPFILGLGLPGSSAPLFWIPWLVLALTLATLGLLVIAWRRRWWGTPARLHFTLVAAAGTSFVVFVIATGLV